MNRSSFCLWFLKNKFFIWVGFTKEKLPLYNYAWRLFCVKIWHDCREAYLTGNTRLAQQLNITSPTFRMHCKMRCCLLKWLSISSSHSNGTSQDAFWPAFPTSFSSANMYWTWSNNPYFCMESPVYSLRWLSLRASYLNSCLTERNAVF